MEKTLQMNGDDLGATEFTPAGDRTKITYLTEMPGPAPAGTRQQSD
jgi:hypothetical protein